MKHLILQNPLYQNLIKDFKKYLQIIGYAQENQYSLSIYVQEFFHQLEHQSINQLNNILPNHITDHYHYLNERSCYKRSGSLSDSMIYKHMYSITLLFNYAQQTGLIIRNPISSLSFPTPKTTPQEIFTPDEIKELYQACKTLRDTAMLGLFYGCGLRISEAVSLNTSDINYRHQLLYVREGKGKKRRVIPLSPKVNQDLKTYYLYERGKYIKHNNTGYQDAFIISRHGNRMERSTYRIRLKNLLSQTTIKKEITPHSLRHSIATHLLDNQLPLEKVKEFLGHYSIDTTQIYTRPNTNKRLCSF